MALAQAIMQPAGRMQPPPAAFPVRRAEAPRTAGAVVPLPGIADVLQRIGQPVVVERHRAVQEAGEPAAHIYKVTDGTLRVVQLLPDGRRHVISFLHAGDFFGLDEQDEYASTVEAITDCSLVRYPRRQFDAVLETDAGAATQVFRMMRHQLSANNRMLLLLGRKTAAERMASFLLHIATRQTRGQKISLPMCRGDIADHLGLTVETVSRLVTKFRQRRLIALASAHEIVILDPEALEEMAGD